MKPPLERTPVTPRQVPPVPPSSHHREMSDSGATNTSRDPQIKGGEAEAGAEEHVEPDKDDDGQVAGGQVSEVASMDPAAADTPISDDQSVAGNPTGESGEVQEPEEAGPNGRPGDNVRSDRRA
jgi:hypothetical protein